MSSPSTPADGGEQNPISATGWRTNAVSSQSVRTLRKGGREYLRFPLIAVAEMVLDYPERGTREYLPASNIRETVAAWDGVPLTYVHPDNRKKTVYDPAAFMGDVIGAFHDPKLLDGGSRLKGNGLIDVQKAEDLGGEAARLVDLLRAGEEVSVSAGYVTMDDEFRSGTLDGDAYDLVQGTVVPDHVAVFPSDTELMARCSPEDGCVAPRANSHHRQNRGSGDYRREPRQQSNGETQTMQPSAIKPNGGRTEPTNENGEPLATRAAFEELKAMVEDLIAKKEGSEHANAGSCECNRANARSGQAAGQANMGAVPGLMRRNYDTGRERQTEDPADYPAGGRSAWERRSLGLADAPEEEETPAGGRSAWEARNKKARANARQAVEATRISPGARRVANSRRSHPDVSDEVAAKYPLSAYRGNQDEN